MCRWQVYDWKDALAVEKDFAERPFWLDPREVLCPVDSTFTVRSYYLLMQGAKAAIYRWCPICHRYSGQTAVAPVAVRFTEPIVESESASLPELLDELDRAWVNGRLPQSFSREQ
jgi:hypothetical protein